MIETAPIENRQCGFVALMGAPNAGKSTLINALVGSKVAGVSRKAQTTRASLRGIVLEGAAQIIFVDTPGLFAPKRRLDRAMAAAAWAAAADADVLALLVDARDGTRAQTIDKQAAAPARDAKTAMQEWAQGRALPAPTYVEVERSGPPHAPQFVMQVVLKGYDPMQGAAPSKRAAEQAAAKAFMTRWDIQ